MAWMLDTHALVWALFEPGKLGKKARGIVGNSSNAVWVSPLSYWEISLKSAMGKLRLPGTDPSEIPDAARRTGFVEETLAPEILSTYHRLPAAPDHRDPFDRLLAWHCICRGHTLLSRDKSMAFYKAHGLSLEW